MSGGDVGIGVGVGFTVGVCVGVGVGVGVEVVGGTVGGGVTDGAAGVGGVGTGDGVVDGFGLQPNSTASIRTDMTRKFHFIPASQLWFYVLFRCSVVLLYPEKLLK